MFWQEVLGRITQVKWEPVEEDIRAAIAYGAEMSRERYVDFLTGAAG